MFQRDSKLIRFSLFAFFALLGGYALYEGWGLLSGPAIDVPHTAMTVSKPYLLVKGTAKRITELHLNGATVPVTEEGVFEEPYLLAAGSNRLVLEARDARGRTDRTELDIAYVPESPSPRQSPPPTSATTTTL